MKRTLPMFVACYLVGCRRAEHRPYGGAYTYRCRRSSHEEGVHSWQWDCECPATILHLRWSLWVSMIWNITIYYANSKCMYALKHTHLDIIYYLYVLGLSIFFLYIITMCFDHWQTVKNPWSATSLGISGFFEVYLDVDHESFMPGIVKMTSIYITIYLLFK